MGVIKERLQSNKLVRVFAAGRVVHPVLIDMFGLAGGFHGFWLDQEHCGITAEQTVIASRTAQVHSMDCFVRVAPSGYWQVSQSIESGACGVMGAQITSAEHAEEFVTWCKFAPRGIRGLNTSGHDANYTHIPPAEFTEKANREHLVAIQIETLGALNEVEQIAAIDGVDLLFIGPADLSQSLGITGQFHHEKQWEAITKVAAAAKKRGIQWGILPTDAQIADRAMELGCGLLSLGNDVVMMRLGVEAVKNRFDNQFTS